MPKDMGFRHKATVSIIPILALGDQALFAMANVLIQVLVARSVSTAEFGAYTVASTFFFVAATVHQTCIVEPMFIFSARRYLGSIGDYHAHLRSNWSILFGVAVWSCGVLLAIPAFAIGSDVLGWCLVIFAFISPFILYLWLLRRMAFILSRIDLSAAASGIYACVLLLTAVIASITSGLDAVGAIALSGLAAIVAAIFLLRLLPWPKAIGASLQDLPLQHFRYGRWALGSEMINWVLINGPILLMPIWFGLAASGQLRTINLLFMPMLQIVSVSSMLLMRELARTSNVDQNVSKIRQFFYVLLIGGTAYSVVVWVTGPTVAPLIFGESYRLDARVLVLAGAGVTFLIAAQAFFVALRMREQPLLVLIVHAVALAVLLCSIPFIIRYGIMGVLGAQAFGWFTAMIVAGALVRRHHPVG